VLCIQDAVRCDACSEENVICAVCPYRYTVHRVELADGVIVNDPAAALDAV
jgi:hypothetical protein